MITSTEAFPEDYPPKYVRKIYRNNTVRSYVHVLFQRCRDTNCYVYTSFIDYSKQFESVLDEKYYRSSRGFSTSAEKGPVITRQSLSNIGYADDAPQFADINRIERLMTGTNSAWT